MIRTTAATGILLMGLAAIACGPGAAPTGQQPMAIITRDSLESFRTAFNEASDQTRVVLLLSPT